jgi:hypothetical protein
VKTFLSFPRKSEKVCEMKIPSKESAVEVQQIIVVAFDVDKIEEDGDDDAHNQCDKDDQLLLLNIRTSEQK